MVLPISFSTYSSSSKSSGPLGFRQSMWPESIILTTQSSDQKPHTFIASLWEPGSYLGPMATMGMESFLMSRVMSGNMASLYCTRMSFKSSLRNALSSIAMLPSLTVASICSIIMLPGLRLTNHVSSPTSPVSLKPSDSLWKGLTSPGVGPPEAAMKTLSTRGPSRVARDMAGAFPRLCPKRNIGRPLRLGSESISSTSRSMYLGQGSMPSSVMPYSFGKCRQNAS
mmetsp:Transcript_55668/g.143426  ORF Transcript_55668/g.143426 Transcript_55668/m.143426 type:complete len:226 (-) Transcript_55668:210-887(-)